MSSIINIECANGEALPYLGNVESDIELEGSSDCDSVNSGLFLVVPDSRYNATTPVLIGTNILAKVTEDARERHETNFLQTALSRCICISNAAMYDAPREAARS